METGTSVIDIKTKLIEKGRKKAAVETDTEILTESDQVFVKDGDRCWFVKLEKIKFETDLKSKEFIFFNYIFIMISFSSQNL